MYDTDSKGISYLAGFFMLIAFAIAGLVVASFVVMPVWTLMTGKSVADMEKYSGDPAFTNAFQVVQVITAIFLFLVPALLTAFLINKKPLRLLGFVKKISAKELGLVLAIALCGIFAASVASYVNRIIPLPAAWQRLFDGWENNYIKEMSSLAGLNTPVEFALSIVIMGFVPALCEETMFRGGLQNFLTRQTKNPWVSIIIVSILFSAMHISYYGFLSRLFLGIVLGLIYYYSGNLWLSILAHFLNNALAVTALYVSNLQHRSIESGLNEAGGSIWLGLLALPVLLYLLWQLKNFYQQQPKPDEVLRT